MKNHEPHESAFLHVTGGAVYVDDIPAPPGMLVGRVVYSTHAHALIRSISLDAARSVPGVHAVASSRDIKGENQMGPVFRDEPCLAQGEVTFVGQAVALIAAETEAQCAEAASRVRVDYEPLDAILDLPSAMECGSVLGPPRKITRGNVEQALRDAPRVLSGELVTGAQEHAYLETQVCLCVPGEEHEMMVYSSTQSPSETQSMVAEVLGVRRNDVAVEVRRIGGGFGGKETQANHVACWAAVLAGATGRPVKIRLRRDDDMIITGKRHRFLIRYRAGFDEDGLLHAVDFELNSDGGAATDLSFAILERAMLHVDNAYFVPNLSVTGIIWKTNLPSNTAFRGFGGPQGMVAIETVIDRVARYLKMDAAEVRRRNFYGAPPRNTTHYEQVVEEDRLRMMHDLIMNSSDYRRRREAIGAYNEGSEFFKKGLALTPVKFGISFTTTFLNQAGALVHIYRDGTVLVSHGGTEMGQGLHTKIRRIVASELGIDADRIKVNPTSTAAVPNTSPTAASSGADLNGMAVKNAIEILKSRIVAGVTRMFNERSGGVPTEPSAVKFEANMIFDAEHPERKISFREAMPQLIVRQFGLSATGYYSTPAIGWDRAAGKGRPFYYYAYGMAVTEVLLDVLTGRHTILRTDILQDAGDSLNRGIDQGQVQGGYVQGVGWCTTEEILWDGGGHLMTHSMDTYKIPAMGDIPEDFRVSFLHDVPNPLAVGRSKAIGEPPFMLALSAWLALKDAVSAVAHHEIEPEFSLPATVESVLLSIERIRQGVPFAVGAGNS